MKQEKLETGIIEHVTEYVYANYKSLKGKKLIISESEAGSCFLVNDHKDGSPLILSRGILSSNNA